MSSKTSGAASKKPDDKSSTDKSSTDKKDGGMAWRRFWQLVDYTWMQD